MNIEKLSEIFKNSSRAPYLFLGSGFSRRYINSPTWESLLQKFAPKHINQYKTTLNTSYLPSIASEIAKDCTDEFWALDDSDEFKKKYKEKVFDQSDVLKYRIADYLQDITRNDFPKEYEEEIELLKKLQIDGIITTNWDDTAERIFPKFKKFVGQKELLLASDSFGMAEIYKIHGCMYKPSSMVLTESDYRKFTQENVYLTAKLLTMFLEHPIVFLGYSISDNNIQSILKSIVDCLDKDNIKLLQNKLIIVEWNPQKSSHIEIERQSIQLSPGVIVPVTRVETHDFNIVYSCINCYERSIPSYVLREYKKQFYNIVISEQPNKKIYLLPETKIEQLSEAQVVIGFGAISKFQSAIGYTGLQAIDILKDVLSEESDWDPKLILSKSIPNIKSTNVFLPMYKYLTSVNIHSDQDYQNNQLGLTKPLRKGLDFATYKSFSDSDKNQTLQEVIDSALVPWKKICLIPHLNIQQVELDLLNRFILQNFDDFLTKKNQHSTYMRKLICFYDWKKYGW